MACMGSVEPSPILIGEWFRRIVVLPLSNVPFLRLLKRTSVALFALLLLFRP